MGGRRGQDGGETGVGWGGDGGRMEELDGGVRWGEDGGVRWGEDGGVWVVQLKNSNEFCEAVL